MTASTGIDFLQQSQFSNVGSVSALLSKFLVISNDDDARQCREEISLTMKLCTFPTQVRSGITDIIELFLDLCRELSFSPRIASCFLVGLDNAISIAIDTPTADDDTFRRCLTAFIEAAAMARSAPQAPSSADVDTAVDFFRSSVLQNLRLLRAAVTLPDLVTHVNFNPHIATVSTPVPLSAFISSASYHAYRKQNTLIAEEARRRNAISAEQAEDWSSLLQRAVSSSVAAEQTEAARIAHDKSIIMSRDEVAVAIRVLERSVESTTSEAVGPLKQRIEELAGAVNTLQS